ncbi:hypothetical protein CQW23_31904 [Capsicum baccatum]|uniref:Uncharacterized protein n=1 Tax=Capsicum baccatum TaxID=33114 RepID=A0A2G2V696_CAPBA|nr:hypothetical protein CQW23_31904 [Capsicum baccatum]
MSIFQISSSHSKKYPKLEDHEAQSIEKKPRKGNRRESLAASEFSMGSPTYGSFTTYERIPAKHRKFSSEFGQLMHSVSKLGVERLHLNFSCGKIPTSKYINLHSNTFFEFSLELLSQASSLKSLFLSVCVVQLSVTLRLNSLETLFLTGVLLETGQLEEDWKRLIFRLQNCMSLSVFFNNRVRFYLSSVPVLEHVKISLRGDASMPYIIGEFAANLPAQVKSLIVTTWNTQGSGMMAKDNSNELASPINSVKNDSMAEDNTDELVSPVTSVKNDSMDEDNIDELVSPVTSVKNDSAESKPDKMSTVKSRSMSYGNKVLPYYRSSSSTSSYNVGNTRRQSTGKLNAPDCGQDVIPHYVRASIGSFHDFCIYGRKRSSEEKPWHPLSRRKNKLPVDEQSPARTLVGEAIKGTFVKQILFTPHRSVLGEKKKLIEVEQKPSTSPGSMLGEAKKRTVVMQKTSTTSRSNQSDAKKGILVKQKLSTPPMNMLEEGKKVNEVYQKPSSPQESVLKDEKEVTMVEQKPSYPPGSMEGGIDEVTMVEQKSSASLVSMLGEGENVTVVEQKLSTPSGSMLVEGNKEVVVNQKTSAPPGSMLGQGKNLNVVDRRPSPKVHSLEPSEIKKKKILLTPKSVHSLKLDSSSDKIPEIEKKIKSSSKILEV